MTSVEMQQRIKHKLTDAGFDVCHESAAVLIFQEPGHPELRVRVGTTHLMVEVNDVEQQRVPLEEFDIDSLQRYIY